MVSDQALSAISGAVGGVVALVATYPLLTISTRLAVQKAKTTDGYTSTLDTFLKIVQQEGWTTLYAGMKSAIFGTAATYGVFYYFYRLCRDFHLRRNDSRPLSTAVSLLVGSEAGAVTAVSTNPIWVVTTMLQANRKQASGAAGAAGSGEAALPTSALEVAKYIVDTEGIKGFFKGVIPALILVINPAVQYMVFEKVKEFYCAKTGRKQLTSLQVFLLGAVAKLAATFVTYPYIVVKTRLQAQKQGASDYYHGTTDVLAKIWHEEGFLGFYKGLNSKITQSVLNASLLFMVQDYINNVCKGLLADTKAIKA